MKDNQKDMKVIKKVLLAKSVDDYSSGFNNIDFNGVKFKKEIFVTKAYDKKEVIGKATPYVEGSALYADIELKEDIGHEYFSMGFRPIKEEIIEGKKYIKEFEVLEIAAIHPGHIITALPPEENKEDEV